jgi:polyvinyl alcohol dehydrogenase (cytochrome)
MVHAIDPDQKGKVLWQTRAGEGGKLGGSQWGSASDGQKVYVAISDVALDGVPDPKAPGGFRIVTDPQKGGGLHALDVKTGKIVWSAKAKPRGGSLDTAGPAVVNGMIFVNSGYGQWGRMPGNVLVAFSVNGK